MGLILKRKDDGEQIPPGEKLRFRINETKRDDGDYGPQGRMELEVISGPFKGETLLEWAKLSQPRTDFVRNLRGKNYSDEDIADILEDRGFEFNDIDEVETEIRLGETGKLMNICMAAFNGDIDTIDSFGSIAELLEALEGKRFVSITKARGTEGKYTGVTWDQVYVDREAIEDPVDLDADLDDLAS